MPCMGKDHGHNITVQPLHIVDTAGTQLAVLYTVQPLHIVDTAGTQLDVLYREVSLIQR